ncbi:MAG: response regulator [Parafilimonas sp.]
MQISELPVFIVNDDEDDHFLVNEVWNELEIKNPLIFFNNGEQLIQEIKFKKTIPFIIISDINLPKIDGFKLRQILKDDESLSGKSIPFVFWSASATLQQIEKAYDLSVQGFFVKEQKFEEIKDTFKRIIAYWFKSKSPEKL